ncbi:MAG: DsrE family protein [Candidatus Bathyarchaeota archaeon]|nr:DsrE family protein [Candidatus Bathyarchaeota archaeon]
MASTESKSTSDTVRGLAEAALARGHRVTAFLNEKSVRLLRKIGDGGAPRPFPRSLQILACRTSAATNGLKSLNDMVDGAEMSSLGELVDLMTDSDRVLFVG